MDDPEDIPADWSTLIRLGIVVAVDLAAARCIVRYGDPDDEDGGAETPPIRWLCGRAGTTRTWSPPSVDEQVLLLTPDGQLGAAIALAGIVQDAFPPLAWQSEQGVEFPDGAKIAYDPETHALEALLPAGGTATIDAPGGLTIRGDVTIEGSVAVSETLTAQTDVFAAGKSLKTHLHLAVQTGTAKSGPPA